MLDKRAIEIIDTLHKKSTNKARIKVRTTSTPKSDERVSISEIDICFNAEYDGWFIKSFWGTKKAYRYRIRPCDINEWTDFMLWLFENNNDELFDVVS